MPLAARFAFRMLAPALAILVASICMGQTAPPRVAITQPSVESALFVSKVVSHTYDLSDAIAAYVNDSDLPADEAREEALTQLFAPGGDTETLIRRKEISPGKYKVWATSSFHAFLPLVIEWMENDGKQICVEVRIATVAEQALKNLHANFHEQWELSTFGENGTDTTQVALPATPSSTPRISFASFNKQAERSTDFISGTTRTVQTLPSRVARLTDEQTKGLINELQADASSTWIQAPKVTIFPGQHATIKDTAQRPFVVSVKPVKGDKDTAMQPIVRVLEEGLTIQVRASLEGEDRLDIASEITWNQIGDVDEFTFQSTTVQIPEQHVQQVSLSKTIDDGATLLIDPHFFKEHTIKKRFRSPVTNRLYSIVLLTPRIISDVPNRSE